MANTPPTPTPTPPPGSSSGSSSSNWSWGPANYDPRVGNGSLPNNFWGAQNRAYVRNTDPNELVSYQLGGLLDSNNPYMQSATRSGYQLANNRGLLNGSIAAGAARRSAIDAALPIAQGNAQAFQNTAAQNQQYLNQQQMAMEGNAASLDAANAAAGAQMAAAKYGDDMALQRQREQLAYGGEQAQLDRTFQDYMSTRGYQNQMGLQQAGLQTQYDLGYRNQMNQNVFNLGANMLQANQNFSHNYALQAMNNPAIMGDPQAFSGYMNFINNGYSGYIDNIFNNLFGGY